MTGFVLKLIAIITMLIDHIGVVFYPASLSFSTYFMFRAIGRIAFPIFCFLIAEGAVFTHDIKKYLLRLGIFALISEVPFNLAMNGTLINTAKTNVFFTLLLGLIAIAVSKSIFVGWKNPKTVAENSNINDIEDGVPEIKIYAASSYTNISDQEINAAADYEVTDEAADKVSLENLTLLQKIQQSPMPTRIFFAMAALCICATAAGILKTDYSAGGVLIIYSMYFFRNHYIIRDLSLALLIFIFFSPIEFYGMIAILFMHLYNHEKGSGSEWIKYGFYAFYPVHLLVLYFISL